MAAIASPGGGFLPVRGLAWSSRLDEPVQCRVAADGDWETNHISASGGIHIIGVLRRQIMGFAGTVPFTSEELADIELAVGEACNNAVKHGADCDESDRITVKCMKNEHTLIVEVSDSGRGFDPESLGTPSPDISCVGGMGVLLMRSLVDDVQFDFHEGTTVRLVKRISGN